MPYDATDDAATGTPSTMFVPMFAPTSRTTGPARRARCTYAGTGIVEPPLQRRAERQPRATTTICPTPAIATTCAADRQRLHASPPPTPRRLHLGQSRPDGGHADRLFDHRLAAGRADRRNWPYYVISSGLTANTFKVSTSSGGSAVNTSGSQSGTHDYNKAGQLDLLQRQRQLRRRPTARARRAPSRATTSPPASLCKYGSATVHTDARRTSPSAVCRAARTSCATAPRSRRSPPTRPRSPTPSTSWSRSAATNILAGHAGAGGCLSPTRAVHRGSRLHRDDDNQKIIILMTDGENTYNMNSKFLQS